MDGMDVVVEFRAHLLDIFRKASGQSSGPTTVPHDRGEVWPTAKCVKKAV